eukprot:6758878-Prorocentrum_lima.AAC.1
MMTLNPEWPMMSPAASRTDSEETEQWSARLLGAADTRQQTVQSEAGEGDDAAESHVSEFHQESSLASNVPSDLD